MKSPFAPLSDILREEKIKCKPLNVIDLTVYSDSEVTDTEDVYSEDDSIIVPDGELELEEDDEEIEEKPSALHLHFKECNFSFTFTT